MTHMCVIVDGARVRHSLRSLKMINEQQRRVANFALRLPDDVLGRIRARAAAHRRSMNSEIVHVLESVL